MVPEFYPNQRLGRIRDHPSIKKAKVQKKASKSIKSTYLKIKINICFKCEKKKEDKAY